MENQHRKIPGYRDLTQAEIDLIRRIKAAEAEILSLIGSVQIELEVARNRGREERDRQDFAEAWRWHAMAKTDIERGFMALVRAVAQPQPVTIPEE